MDAQCGRCAMQAWRTEPSVAFLCQHCQEGERSTYQVVYRDAEAVRPYLTSSNPIVIEAAVAILTGSDLDGTVLEWDGGAYVGRDWVGRNEKRASLRHAP